MNWEEKRGESPICGFADVMRLSDGGMRTNKPFETWWCSLSPKWFDFFATGVVATKPTKKQAGGGFERMQVGQPEKLFIRQSVIRQVSDYAPSLDVCCGNVGQVSQCAMGRRHDLFRR